MERKRSAPFRGVIRIDKAPTGFFRNAKVEVKYTF